MDSTLLEVSPRNMTRLPWVITAPAALREAQLARELTARGAVLFRGFGVDSHAAFERFVRAQTPELLEYEFGSTPRTRVEGQVYTSTEYPAHQHIPLHNEQSYTREWPLKIWFCCIDPGTSGGATPIADSRLVLQQLSRSLRERFDNKRVMYVRNYGNGLDLPWQKVFRTDDPREVEQFCQRAGISCEWKADGELRTRQVCQAVARHPSTHEWVWFNQAHLFHVSSLDPAVSEALLGVVDEEDLPRNAYYGDGTALEADALAEIRAAYAAASHTFAWQRGDVMWLDNMLVAHGRAPFTGARRVLVAMAEAYANGAL
jgi:alpha-ketoglutarate-dependent taurine dioxygenase